MKRNVFGACAAVVLSGVLVGAQGQYPSSSPAQSPPQTPAPAAPARTQPATPATPSADVILEGCLVQGSGPTVFVLENAKLSTQDRTARGMSYIVSEATAADLDLSDHLNHQVRLTGLTTPAPAASTPPAPSGASAQPGQAAPGGAASGGAAASSAAGQRTAAAERMMAKITAKNLTKVSDTCVQAGD